MLDSKAVKNVETEPHSVSLNLHCEKYQAHNVRVGSAEDCRCSSGNSIIKNEHVFVN